MNQHRHHHTQRENINASSDRRKTQKKGKNMYDVHDRQTHCRGEAERVPSATNKEQHEDRLKRLNKCMCRPVVELIIRSRGWMDDEL